MTTAISKLTIAAAFSIGLSSAAIAGGPSTPNAPPVPPGAVAAALEIAGFSGITVSIDPVTGRYIIVTPGGRRFAFSSETVAAFMAVY